MTTKRKTAAPKKSPVPPLGEPKPRQLLKGATLMHFTYSPEGQVLRANVQQDFTLGGNPQRVGQDIDIALKDLGTGLRASIEQVFSAVAKAVSATPFKPQTPKKEAKRAARKARNK